MSLEMSAAAAAVAAAAAASRRSNRRKTLSHADLEDFLCTVGDPEGAAMVVERDAADGAGGACHGNACPSSAGATVPTVVYTDEQRIRDIYKVRAPSRVATRPHHVCHRPPSTFHPSRFPSRTACT